MHKQAGRRLPARETFFVISIINNSGRKKPRQRTKKMEAFVTTGLVLKETRYKESDRILTILTPELGVISAAAQSSLRLKSKLFSACGLFCYSEFTLVPGRNMYTVREAEVKNVFHGISSSIEGMSLAMYMAEMAMTLSPTGQEAQRELRLLLNCFYMISESKTDLRVIKAVFELRTMSECGFMPQIVCCRVAAPMMVLRSIWMCRKAICSVQTAPQKQERPATLIRVHCMRCGTSALWTTKKYLHSKFLWAVWKSFPQWQSAMH